MISKRRDSSAKLARRVIRTMRPSQTASRSSLVINSGRGVFVDCTTTLSSPTLPSRRKPPSLSTAMAGKGVVARRAQSVRYRAP